MSISLMQRVKLTLLLITILTSNLQQASSVDITKRGWVINSNLNVTFSTLLYDHDSSYFQKMQLIACDLIYKGVQQSSTRANCTSCSVQYFKKNSLSSNTESENPVEFYAWMSCANSFNIYGLEGQNSTVDNVQYHLGYTSARESSAPYYFEFANYRQYIHFSMILTNYFTQDPTQWSINLNENWDILINNSSSICGLIRDIFQENHEVAPLFKNCQIYYLQPPSYWIIDNKYAVNLFAISDINLELSTFSNGSVFTQNDFSAFFNTSWLSLKNKKNFNFTIDNFYASPKPKRCAASPYPCGSMADCRISNGKSTCTCRDGYDDISEEKWYYFGASGTSCREKKLGWRVKSAVNMTFSTLLYDHNSSYFQKVQSIVCDLIYESVQQSSTGANCTSCSVQYFVPLLLWKGSWYTQSVYFYAWMSCDVLIDFYKIFGSTKQRNETVHTVVDGVEYHLLDEYTDGWQSSTPYYFQYPDISINTQTIAITMSLTNYLAVNFFEDNYLFYDTYLFKNSDIHLSICNLIHDIFQESSEVAPLLKNCSVSYLSPKSSLFIGNGYVSNQLELFIQVDLLKFSNGSSFTQNYISTFFTTSWSSLKNKNKLNYTIDFIYTYVQKRCAASPYRCDQMADCRISNGKSTCTCAAGYTDYSETNWYYFGASGTSCGPCSVYKECPTSGVSTQQMTTVSLGAIKDTTQIPQQLTPTTSKGTAQKWCDTQPCLRGGLCKIDKCLCPSGFEGSLCEKNVDDCVSNGISVCKNGGYCVDKLNAYSCICKNGFTGKDCSADIDECADINNNPDLCPIDADCVNIPGSYKCACKEGFTGKNCVLLALNTKNNNKLEQNWMSSSVPIFLANEISVGSSTSDFLRISQYGFVSLGNTINWWSSKPPSEYIKYSITSPLIYPYWYFFDYYSSLNGSISYQELTNSNDSSLQFRTIDKMVQRLTGNRFYTSKYNLVVNWNSIEPWNYYRYFYFWYRNYFDEDLYNQIKEQVTFQLIISTDGSYYYAVFNYEDFNLKEFRTGSIYYWYWWNNPAAGVLFSNGTWNDIKDITVTNSNSSAWNPQTAPGNVIGSSGKPTKGRYGIILSTPEESNSEKQCHNWIDKNKNGINNTKIEQCDNCPETFEQAIIDRRYSAIDVSCDGKKDRRVHMTMCFDGPRISAEFEMRTISYNWCWWWYCYRYSYTYRHTLKWIVPRCCYKTSIDMKEVENNYNSWFLNYYLINYCNSQYGEGLRWIFRWSGLNFKGTFTERYSNGAIPPLVYYTNYTDYWSASADTMNAYQNCKSARKLHKIENVRPHCTTNNYNFSEAVTRGDPHITTMDGNFYTFNGLCEFIMIQSVGSEVPYLLVQSRTELASSRNPHVQPKATIFTGFAIASNMKHKALVVLLNRNESEVGIYYENTFQTKLSDLIGKNASNFDHFSVVAVDNSTLTITVQSTGFVMEVTKTLDFLQASFQLADVYRNRITGLMGNFNKDKSDDYVMRNGTRISENSTEREIFQFGLTWRVFENESIFYFVNGTRPNDFCDLNFEPVFTDDFRDPDKLLALFNNDANLLSAANITCRNSIEALYLSCMYDASQMQSLDAAKESKSASEKDRKTNAVATNQPPRVNMPASINLTVNQDFQINLDFVDTEEITYEVKLYNVLEDGSVGNEMNNSFVAIRGNTLVWSNISNNSVVMRVIGSDSSSASSDWQPIVLLCHCLNGGSCSYEKMVSNNASDSFYKAFCNCVNKYSGESCEISPCDSKPNPCFNASQCAMLNNATVSCGVCPEGQVGNAFGLNGCQDVDECFNNTRLCQDKCVNLDPGYKCECTLPGFQVDVGNPSACVDIDECVSGMNNSCDARQNQTCVNTIGSYDCVCPRGTEYIRMTGSCVDVNECALDESICGMDSVCVNLENTGYQCLCKPLFIQDLNGKCVHLVDVIVDDTKLNVATSAPKESTRKIFKLRSTLKFNNADIDFSSDLKNQQSDQFNKFVKIVEPLVRDLIAQIDTLKDTKVMCEKIEFFKGSIIFTMELTFDPQITLTEAELASLLNNANSKSNKNEYYLDNIKIVNLDDQCSIMGSLMCDSMATCANSLGNYSCTCNKGYKDVSSPNQQGTRCQSETDSSLALALGLGIGLSLFVILILLLIFVIRKCKSRHNDVSGSQVRELIIEGNKSCIDDEKGSFNFVKPPLKELKYDGFTEQIPHNQKISKSGDLILQP